MTSQFEGAERIADKWGISRARHRRVRSRSQQRAAEAWAEGRFDGQCVDDRRTRPRRRGQAHRHHPQGGARRGPPRDARSRSWPPSSRSPARTACTPPAPRRQISDGAAAVLMMTEEKAAALGFTPRARDRRHLPRRRRPGAHAHRPDRRHRSGCSQRTGLGIDDIDVVRDQRGVRVGRARLAEGSSAPTWTRSTRTAGPSPSATRSAPPVGSCSPRRCTSWSAPAAGTALVTMCCGGGLGTGTIIERLVALAPGGGAEPRDAPPPDHQPRRCSPMCYASRAVVGATCTAGCASDNASLPTRRRALAPNAAGRARRRRRHDRRLRRRHRGTGAADRHRHARDEEAEHAGAVLRPRGDAPTPTSLLPAGTPIYLERDAGRPRRLRPAAGLRVPDHRRPVRQPRHHRRRATPGPLDDPTERRPADARSRRAPSRPSGPDVGLWAQLRPDSVTTR